MTAQSAAPIAVHRRKTSTLYNKIEPGNDRAGVARIAIVTIAHEMSSGGPEIGIELAKRLGWRYVDRDMLSEAAQRYGVGVDKLTELDEKKPSLFERFDV